MNNVSRRSVLFAVGASALGLAGCSSSSDAKEPSDLSKNKADSMKTFNVGDQFKATSPITFSTLYNNNPSYPTKKNWLLWDELKKRTNVTLDTTVVPLSDYEQKRSVIIGSGDAPFIIPKTYFGGEIPFIASGAIIPVSDYTHLMPNFTDKVKRWKLDGDLDQIRQTDGKFYVVPGLHEEIWPDYSLAIRTDVLDDLKLDIPKTTDDLYDVLKAMKQAHPDLYPMTDRWNVPTPGGALLKTLGTAFGTHGGWDYLNPFWDSKAGKFVLTGAMDEYRSMLTFANKLVKEKLLDPESFTQTDDQAVEKFTSGKSFMISANAQELVNTYRKALAKTVPGAKILKIANPIGPAGPVKEGSRLENGMMITKKARDSKDFVALLQFIDWLVYSDEGEEFTKWGVEGVTYTKDSAGNYKLTKDVNIVGLNPSGTKDLQRDFGFNNGNFSYGGSTKLLESMFPEEEKEFQKTMRERKALPVQPPYPLTSDEREQADLWDAPLKDYVFQETLKFVLGKRPLSEWDKYLGELKAKNSESYIDLVNKAHDRFQKKNG
ncbi:ABC transporter substrate-binding protein [Streptomyces odontomachi]|uniref:ABC transporter substrate-binding protein n=1 Tax=Streptomyces odontomachi TaxID=2944940 RepID=UPI00210CCC57|nr:extracellular solute-binding protein [Streptomyces sp. ODS25]